MEGNRFVGMVGNAAVLFYDRGAPVGEEKLAYANSGSPILPRVEDNIVIDGKLYTVQNVEWNCDRNEITVHAHR